MLRPRTALSHHPVVGSLLGNTVLPGKAAPFERISAAITVRAALVSRESPRTLLFLVPEGTPSTARYITAGLIAGNHGHANGYGRLPPEEVRPLLKSNSILLVTPAVSECMDDLEALKLGGTTALTELWDIVPLANQTARSTTRGRVFVANPGWAVSKMLDRRYSAVIVDATHPRTLAKFEQLMKLARGASSLRVVVAPVLPSSLLAELVTDHADVWLWDPRAKRNAWGAVNGKKPTHPDPAAHTFWVCDGDAEIDTMLAAAHHLLVSAARASKGRSYPGLPLAWSIVSRLRSLTVPLNRYEQAASKAWAGSLADRLRMLADVAGYGDAIWDATWPDLRAAIQAVYGAFTKRTETAKFWALAERLDAVLQKEKETYRIVAPSAIEASLLISTLQDVIDELPEALAAGRLEIVAHAEEARRIAMGDVAHTLLVGPRPTRYRYLNHYPSKRVEQFVYPFETFIEPVVLDRQYNAAVRLQGKARCTLLQELCLDLVAEVAGTPSPTPEIALTRAGGREVVFAKVAAVDGDLDLDALASADTEDRAYASSEHEITEKSGAVIDVLFKDGIHERYAIEQLVDLYYPETDQVHRESASVLKPGMCVIRFLDGRYDSLFRRTTEAVESRLSTRHRATLELWHQAKGKLIEQHSSKRELFDKLQANGLGSSYLTFLTWFRDDYAIAPQQIDDFIVIAKATGLYRTDAMVRGTFRCIQQVRGRNRTAGRKLRALLRALVSHGEYEEALDSIRRVDPGLADVYAAVDVVEIERIQHL